MYFSRSHSSRAAAAIFGVSQILSIQQCCALCNGVQLLVDRKLALANLALQMSETKVQLGRRPSVQTTQNRLPRRALLGKLAIANIRSLLLTHAAIFQ